MKTNSLVRRSSDLFSIALAIVLGFVVIVTAEASAGTKEEAAGAPQTQRKQFNAPKEAADSLVQAAESFDVAALKEILRPDSADIISSEDLVQDKNKAAAFAAKAKEKSSIGTDAKNPNVAILTVGNDDFPLPIPIALAAAPAQYRVTGVKTFMAGPNGVVYEKDLGKDTLKTFQEMEKYNPDKTWKSTDDDWPEGKE